MSAGRAWHGAVAILALVGLAIEYHAAVAGHPGELLVRSGHYLCFFTILGNALVAAMAAGFALDRRWAQGAALRAATTLTIVTLALVFQLLLAAIVRPTGIDWWGNMLAHRLVPALWTVGWAPRRHPCGHAAAVADLPARLCRLDAASR